MKEEIKIKEEIKKKDNIITEPAGTMPVVGAMQQLQAVPGVPPVQTPQGMQGLSPVQAAPGAMAVQSDDAPDVMPSMANQGPVMCCPFLMNMNMQCPLTYGYLMGMNMMHNPMLPGIGPVPGNIGLMAGNVNLLPKTAEYGMNITPGPGTMPQAGSNPCFPINGMGF